LYLSGAAAGGRVLFVAAPALSVMCV
jgi:hypothetical protein